MKKSLIICLLTAFNFGLNAQDVSPMPPAPYQGEKVKKAPSNIKINNRTINYSDAHILRMVDWFKGSVKDIDATVKFVVTDNAFSNEIDQKMIDNYNKLPLKGNQCMLLIQMNRQGRRTYCNVRFSEEMEETVRQQLEEVNICSRM